MTSLDEQTAQKGTENFLDELAVDNVEDGDDNGVTNSPETPVDTPGSMTPSSTVARRSSYVLFNADAGAHFKKKMMKEKKQQRDFLLKVERFKSDRTIGSVREEGFVDSYGSIDTSLSDGEMYTFLKKRPYYSPDPAASATFRDNIPPEIAEIKLETKVVLKSMLFGSGINILLLVMPFALASHYLHWSPVSIFVLNFLTMIPLAALLGDFTEEVAAHTNQTIGGLINASFGNAVEVVVAIEALLAGEYRVVQASMIGSIFSNLLLVLGCCFLFGGIYYTEQEYSALNSTANMGLLGLSCIALILPTPFAEYYDINDEDALVISRIAAVFLIFMYAQLLLFQMKTHADLLGEEDSEEITLPFSVAIGALVAVTAVIALLSNFLVASIDGFCEESGISRTFTGLIILPIVGNAVEHMTAVSVAMKDKMDLAMGGK